MGLGGYAGAIARRGGRHVLTSTGRRMLADPAVAWDALIAHLGGPNLFTQTVAETATLLLVDQAGTTVRAGDLWQRVADIAVELGWQNLAEPDEDVALQSRLHGIDWWLFHGITCGLLVVDDIPGPYLHVADDSPIAITPTGEKPLLAAISRRATGPVTEALPAPTVR
jgi:hypothetical protein